MKPFALWSEIVGGPIAWLVYLQAAYVLAGSACVAGTNRVLALTMIAALLATLAITLLSWRSWRMSGATFITDNDDVMSRSRFMALSGLGASALSVLLVLASAVPIFMLGACD